jgi:hypothetical protein
MAGKDLTELASVDNITTGDLLLVRKSDLGTDKKISYQDLVKSIGNPGVEGFTAVSDGENKVMIAAANGAIITKYYPGMKISFVSPLKSTGAVQVSVAALPYKNLLAYKSTSSVAVEQDDYIEAVFIGDAFYQVNNAQYVYTSDYKIKAVSQLSGGSFTNIDLESSYGNRKAQYYEGMTVNFICSENTTGGITIDIDGLGGKPVIENSGDYTDEIYTPMYKGQIVHLVYDGQNFVKDRFRTDNPKLEPVVAPDPDNPDQPLVPAANQITYTVGTAKQFPNLSAAFLAALKEYGENGRKQGVQQKVVLEVTNVLSVNDNKNTLYLEAVDLSWITITATGNVLKFMGNMNNNYHIFRFIGAPAFAEGLTIDITNVVSNSNGTSYFHFMEVDSLFLKNIKIKATATQNIRDLFSTSSHRVKKSMTLIDTEITGGNVAFSVENCELTLQNVKANGWGSSGVGLRGHCILTVTNSDLSKAGTASTYDIQVSGNTNTVIQINSRAKVNIALNTTDSEGNKYELRAGTQDIQGVS